MKEERVEEILELYGLDRILEDNNMKLIELMDLLNELGYINLDMYDCGMDT